MLDQAEAQERVSLRKIAMLALEFGRILMEAGSGARRGGDHLTGGAGLGAERTELRVGYASLAITVGMGHDGITRMRKVGPLCANQSLDDALHGAAARIERGGYTQAEARAGLDRLVRATPRHADWVVAVAVGVVPPCYAQHRRFHLDHGVGLSG